MAMLEVDKPADMKAHIGQRIGSSDWVTVDQAMIDKFADATGDHQWIHVDVERAKREMPGGKTIAHGFLTLSLLAGLAHQVYAIRQRSRGINYGSNRVRFTAPVPVGSRVRLHQTLKNVEAIDGGVRMTFESTMEVEGSTRPALVAETLNLAYD
ncbi:MAG TPA: MaoC family dehydratase [Acetobacteraceae bacterium]|nr:MaoC family dehydratase [Acetobacteraceae bacterium]